MSRDSIVPDQDDNDLSLPLFDCYCAWEANPENMDGIEAWFLQHNDQRDWYGRFRAAFPIGETLVSAAEVARYTEAIVQTVRDKHPRELRTVRLRRMWHAMTGIVISTAAVVAVWTLHDVRSGKRDSQSAEIYRVYATGKVHPAALTLPDGNTVVLNVGSRLEVPVNYLAGNHVVRLSMGEALFSVVHHAGNPLTILAGSTMTRVLGTRFAVRHYQTDMSTTVAVAEGKVMVDDAVVTTRHSIEVSNTGIIQLHPTGPSQFSFAIGVQARDSIWMFGNLLRLEPIPQIERDKMEWTLYSSRTRMTRVRDSSRCGAGPEENPCGDVLMLEQMRLSKAIPKLDRWFGVNIRLGDSTLRDVSLAAQFAKGSVTDLAAVLEIMYNVRVVRDGRTLTLYSKPK
jgi:ferric-dicitrate binding protein FerR (iron transport regulator)